MNARMAAIVLGVILIIAGIIGFIDNPIASGALDTTATPPTPTALFFVNTPHNIVHIASGLFLLIGAWTALGSLVALRILGIIYVVIVILGFLGDGSSLAVLTFVSNNSYDNWLHIVVALLLLAAGFGLQDDETSTARM